MLFVCNNTSVVSFLDKFSLSKNIIFSFHRFKRALPAHS